jgi:cell division protein FtsB
VKVLVPTTVTILTYLLLSLVWADYGIVAFDRLDAYRARLETNMGRLEERGIELAAETRSLRTDADRIRVEARRLGYFGENEGRIRVEGFETRHDPSSPGALVKHRPAPRNNDATIRAAAASAGLFALFIMLLLDQRERR